MLAQIDHEATENASEETRHFYNNKSLFRKNIFWYISGGSAGALGFNTAQGLMPMHMAKIGMDPEQISLAMSIRGWVYMVLVLYLSHLSDHLQCKWGRRIPFLAVSLPFLVLGMIFFPFMVTAFQCVALFAIFSIFVAVKYDTYSLLTYDIARQSRWGMMAGLASLFGNVGILVGQHYLMPLVDIHGEKYVYLLCAIYLLVATLPTLLFLKEPPIRTAARARWNPFPVILSTLAIGFREKRNAWLFIGFSLVTAPGLAFNYLAVQGQTNLHMTQGAVGIQLLQWGTLASMCMAPILGLVVDRIGAVRVVFIGYLLSFASVYFGFNPHAVRELTVATILLTVGFNAMYMAGIVFVAGGIERSYMAIICGCNGAISYLMSSLFLVLSGILIKRVFSGNYGAIFLISICLATLGMPLLLWLDRLRRSPHTRAISFPSAAPSSSIPAVPEFTGED
jgi:MFS family permease